MEHKPDMHAIGHDVASTATRDALGHIVHVTDQAKAEMSEAGTYWSHHLQRDAHGHFLPQEAAGGGGGGGEHKPDMHAIGHDVASTATRDAHGHIVHVTDQAKAEMSEAGTYWSHHLQRDAHGHFLPAEQQRTSGAEEQHPRDEHGRFVAKK